MLINNRFKTETTPDREAFGRLSEEGMLLAMLEIQGIDPDAADDWPKNLPEDELNSIYEELSFSLRHNVERTKASRASGMALVPAPMREDGDESDQPLDSAGTYRMATMRVPAPRLELGTP